MEINITFEQEKSSFESNYSVRELKVVVDTKVNYPETKTTIFNETNQTKPTK